jgi:hypothetical protein
MDLLGGGRVVAFRVDLALAVGSTTAGLLLSQFWYWTNQPSVEARDGWFWKTIAEIGDETGLSRPEQETARKRLRQLGLLEEDKRGVPMKLWFRLDKQRLIALLREYVAAKHAGIPQDEHAEIPHDGKPAHQHAGFQHVSVRDFRKIARGKAESLEAGFPQDISETTSEITQKNTQESTAPDPSPSHSDPPGDEESGPPGVSSPGADHFATAVDDPLVFLWRSALPALAECLNKPTFETHIRALRPVSLDETDAGAHLTLAAPNTFTRDWIDKRHGQTICDVLAAQLGHAVSVRLVIDTKEAPLV